MFYYISKLAVILYLKIFYRVSSEGSEKIPKSGPVIICANHINNLDALVVGTTVKRPVNFIAKNELFKNKALGLLLKNLKAVPVDRQTTDMAMFRNIISLLKTGNVVGIFAHGTRVKKGEEKAAKAGVALFAIKGNSDVVPAYISGDFKLFGKINIKYGDVIDLDKYRQKRIKTDTLGEITEYIMSKVNELGEEN